MDVRRQPRPRLNLVPGGARKGEPAVDSTFASLAQLCLAELRGDVARLFETQWDGAQQRRTLELVAALEQACERQGLRRLALAARSMGVLAALRAEDALPLSRELRKKFKELLSLAEACLLQPRRSPALA